MPFVSRNTQGAITGVFGRPTPVAQEELDTSDPELRAFLQGPGARHGRSKLSAISPIFRAKRSKNCCTAAICGAISRR